jgi:hypothetical protein
MLRFTFNIRSNRLLPVVALATVVSSITFGQQANPQTPSPLETQTTSPSAPNPALANNTPSDQIFAQGDTVEIAHPYNPKPLGIIPTGWVPEAIPNYSVRNSPVALKNGRTVTIDCPIFALVPNTRDQYHAFREPGFDSAKGNSQSGTLGNIVTRYIAENDRTGREIDAALVQIRNSFASSENKPDINPDTKLLIDKPNEPPTQPTTDAVPASTPAASENPSPTPEAKKKLQPAHAHESKKPKASPTPSPTPVKKLFGLFLPNPKLSPSPTSGKEKQKEKDQDND